MEWSTERWTTFHLLVKNTSRTKEYCMSSRKAPSSWHEANMVLGSEKPCNSREISGHKDDGTPFSVTLGAVGQYKRIKPAPSKDVIDTLVLDDTYTLFDWELDNGFIEEVWSEENDGKMGNLLDFYVLPGKPYERRTASKWPPQERGETLTEYVARTGFDLTS